MIKAGKSIYFLINISIIFLVANCVSLHLIYEVSIVVLVLTTVLFGVLHFMPFPFNFAIETKRHRNSKNGCELLKYFLVSTILSCIYSVLIWVDMIPVNSINNTFSTWIFNTIVAVIVEASIFWNGIIRIYITSKQLGMRWRVIGIACGMIPVVNLIVLLRLIQVVESEVEVEDFKIKLNKKRNKDEICKTKYPIFMVHGVFFRDYRYFNYWGRIPKELETNGATVFYGMHQSASSVKESAIELTERIKSIVKETGCEKVNIIAHSKGGLDCRYAVAKAGAAPYVASLTTINTPHRGCEFADYLLSRIPDKQKNKIANAYNEAMEKLGDSNPDFLEAANDLTAAFCRTFNEEVKDVEGIYYQSVGSKLNCAMDGRFPLNLTYELVNYFDGDNDGLVGEKSFEWGENYDFLSINGKRGISHGDMIDLNRENIVGFDVREYYVQLVNRLKKKGL